MLKPIINQKWARPPTPWKANSAAKAWQSPTCFVLPLSRLDNHTGNVNVIILKILSQVWRFPLPSCLIFMCQQFFYIIIHTKLTPADYTTNEWTARPFLDMTDKVWWKECLLIIRWQMGRRQIQAGSGHYISQAPSCYRILSGGSNAEVGAEGTQGRLDGQKQMRW